MSDNLREEIADIIAESSIRYYDDGPLSKDAALEWADDVLDLVQPRMVALEARARELEAALGNLRAAVSYTFAKKNPDPDVLENTMESARKVLTPETAQSVAQPLKGK